jgi:sec-independent protein translocase protein TatA
MFGLGTQELMIILVMVMVVFVAGKLPQFGGAIGNSIRNFKQGISYAEDETALKIEEKKDGTGAQI